MKTFSVPLLLLAFFCFFTAQLYGQCPQITGILVNSCGGNTNEGRDEFFTFRNGTSPLSLNTWIVTFPQGGGTNYCNNGTCGTNNWQIPNGTTAAVVATLNAGCPGLLVEPPGGIIPPFAYVLVFCSGGPIFNYNFCTSCNVGPIYVVFTNSNSTIGKFSNTSIRTMTIDFGGGCTDAVTYDPVNFVPPNSDGNFSLFDPITNAATYTTYSCPGCIPLPIRLKYFQVNTEGNGNLISWEFEPEGELPDAMEIEINYPVQGIKINSNPIQINPGIYAYQYFDAFPEYTPVSYRIKMTNSAGDIIYGEPKLISFQQDGISNSIELIPNPISAGDNLLIKFNNNDLEENLISGEIKLFDLSGKIIGDEIIPSTASKYIKFKLPENISPGIYRIQLNSSGRSYFSPVYIR
ncbi:MAG: T9SS C-terminal target domain-containing protein [Sphingobacteriia bacterium]|nr:T9SS C-terminal target domain-containing protein [Sphingobacteriia bacterium]